MKPGVMDAVVGGRDDEEVFRRARRIGFAGVEVDLRRNALRAGGEARLHSLAAAARSSSLEVPSLVLGGLNDGGLGSEDPAVREEAAEDIRRAAAWAQRLAADAVLVPFFLQGELLDRGHVERAGRALRDLCREAASRGVSLLYEGTLPAAGVRELAALVDSPSFGCYFDMANPVARAMDTAVELKALGDLVRRMHLKDTRVRGGDARPGLGRVDFAATARAVEDVGYDDWLVLETPPGPEEVVRRDLAFGQSAFPSLERLTPWPRLGAFSYDFGHGTWDELGRAFRELGLDVVQLGGALLEECLEDPARIEPATARLEEHGVRVAALAGYQNLVARDAGRRREGIELLARCLELAPRFGTSVVATETGTRNPESDWADSPENSAAATWDVLVDALETLVPVAERAGTILALEAHAANVLKHPGHLMGVLDRFPTPHLQVVCDPYNFLSRHQLPAHERLTRDLLDRFEDRFVVAHLKDVAIVDGALRTPEFGTGVFAQRPYVRWLRRRRPDLPMIFEHLPLEHLPAAILRLRALSGHEQER